MRPIELLPALANQSAPSGPEVIPIGMSILGPMKFVTTPLVLILPIE